MRKFLVIFMVFVLSACASAPVNVDDEVYTTSSDVVVSTASKTKVSDALLDHGYVQSRNYFFKLYEENDGLFYYVFNLNNDYFTLINAYTGDNYTTPLTTSRNTFMDVILDDELKELGLKRSSFNPAIKKVETIYLGEFRLSKPFLNVYQVLMKDGYYNMDGYYVKDFEFGKVAFNLKQATITVWKSDEEAYYQFDANYDYHKYTYLGGESTYNKYDEDRSSNCSADDESDILNAYDECLESVLDELGVELYDLQVYKQYMIDSGEWSGYQNNVYDVYPNLNADMVNIDEEIAAYVRHEFESHGATIRDTSIEVSYNEKLAVFYFEDKTFIYGTNHVLYDWKRDVASVGKCIYDYASDIGCSESDVKAAKETRSAYQSILNNYGLLTKELHQYANSLRLYDKTLGGESDAE